jgi:CRISPR/Cas system-associated endoribonuclease Cas2
MSVFYDKDGYKRIQLTIDGKYKKYHIHRLVYSVFVGEIPSNKVCCHMDGDKLNNHWSNLAIATQKENIAHKKQHGTWQAGDKHPRVKYPDSLVIQIQERLNQGERPHLIACLFNVPYSFVDDVKRGNRKTLEQRL